MILPDSTIRSEVESGRFCVDPFDPSHIGPASIDVTLGTEFMTALPGATIPVIDPMSDLVDDTLHYQRVVADGDPHPEEFHLYPSQFVIAHTVERMTFPDDIAARIEGKASLARYGLMVCPTASFISPGYKGQVMIELYNLTNRPIRLTPGMRIAQLVLFRMEDPVENPYAGSMSTDKVDTAAMLRKFGLTEDA